MKKYILILIIVLVFLLFASPFRFFWHGYGYFISSPSDIPIDILQYPQLTDIPKDMKPIQLTTKHWDISLEPRLRYSLPGKVLFSINTQKLSERLLIEAFDNEYMPIDLLIVWGKLTFYDYAIRDYHIGASFSRYAVIVIDYDKIRKKEGTIPEDICKDGKPVNCYSHNHIIPANKNILFALKRLAKRGKEIKLEGYLIDIHKKRLDKPDLIYPPMITSVTLGDHSCELFYVDKIQIGSRVFQ